MTGIILSIAILILIAVFLYERKRYKQGRMESNRRSKFVAEPVQRLRSTSRRGSSWPGRRSMPWPRGWGFHQAGCVGSWRDRANYPPASQQHCRVEFEGGTGCQRVYLLPSARHRSGWFVRV